MDIAMAARLLWCNSAMSRRERWPTDRIEMYQTARLRELRLFALEHSPFYRAFHKGLDHRLLADLPILSKQKLMEAYDDIVIDRSVRLVDLRQHIHHNAALRLYRGRYRVCATSGTSGEPVIFLYDPNEWVWILSSFARANRLAGVSVGLLHQLRLAVVGSSKPSHQSSAVAESLDCTWFPTLRLSPTDPIAGICRDLTDWNPQLIVTYAGFAGTLAEEQLAGRLNVRPKAVMCVAESLTGAVRAQVRHAWGCQPFENYACTEAGCIAAECGEHAGLHIFNDLLVTEFVDDEYRPVPVGSMACKLLITVLFSRTLPLIRYELDDAATLSHCICKCRLPFPRLTKLGGRIAETLRILRADGSVAVLHPTQFEDAIGLTGIRCWQVLKENDCVHVRLLAPVSEATRRHVEENLRVLFEELGVGHLSIKLEIAETIARAPSGKMLLVHDAKAS